MKQISNFQFKNEWLKIKYNSLFELLTKIPPLKAIEIIDEYDQDLPHEHLEVFICQKLFPDSRIKSVLANAFMEHI